MDPVFGSRFFHLVILILTKFYPLLAHDEIPNFYNKVTDDADLAKYEFLVKERSKLYQNEERRIDFDKIPLRARRDISSGLQLDVSAYNETQNKCLLKHKFLDVVFVIDSQDVESDFLEFKDVVLNTLNLFDMTIGATQIGMIMNNKVEVKLQTSTKIIQSLQYNDNETVPLNLLDTLETSRTMFDEASKHQVVGAKKVLILVFTTKQTSAEVNETMVHDFVSNNQDIEIYLLLIGTTTTHSFAAIDAHITMYSNNTAAAKSALNNQIVHIFECDPCSPDPCKMSNETCVVDDRVEEGFRCVCSKYDPICSCANYLRCQNGGFCVHSVTSPTRCICTEGWEGTDCSLRNCEGHICGSNSHCEIIGRKDRRCVCNVGWEGHDCSQVTCHELSCEVNEYCMITDENRIQCLDKSRGSCDGLYCIHGVCLSEGDSKEMAICVCNIGYKGDHCDVPTCQLNPCGMHGTCQDQLNKGFKCTCNVGFSGTNCEISDENPCASDPCKNKCVCKESCKHSGGFTCSSEDGYLGKTCGVAPPHMDCGYEKIIIEISNEILSDMNIPKTDESYLYISPDDDSNPTQDCRSRASIDGLSQRLQLQSHFTACGTLPQTNVEGFVVVRNTVWMNVGDNQLFSIPLPIFQFECRYSLDMKFSSPIQPIIVEDDVTDVGGESEESINSGSLVLCKEVNKCVEECPPSLTVGSRGVYTVGERVNAIIKPHGEFTGTSGLLIRKLYLSCSAKRSVRPILTLVENGCSTGSISTVVGRSLTSVCVSFQVLRISEDHSTLCDGGVYIHATMSDCSSYTKCPNSLEYTSCEVRSKRQVRDSVSVQSEVYGPIYVVEKNGGGYSFVNSSVEKPTEKTVKSRNYELGKDDETKLELTSTSEYIYVYVLVALLSIFLVFATTLFVVFYKRRRIRVNVEPETIENYRVRQIDSTNVDLMDPF